MDLIIVESPTKAKTLNRFLGDSYQVEATMGHIKDLPKSKLGVDVDDNFKTDFIVIPKKEKDVAKLKKIAKKAKDVYIATDPDREGEAIAAHVGEVLDIKNPKRISFHEITKEAIIEALRKPHLIDRNLVDAQTARRVLDRIVGYKLSPLLWRKVRRGLSAGRVQSVTVRLIVERENEIEAFKSAEYWQVFCDLKTIKTPTRELRVELIKISDKKFEIKNKEESDKVVADLKSSDYIVSALKKREVRKNAYPPFTTSTMTQGAARIFGWSAKKTMSVAQKLYEEGVITYHRTDSTNIAKIAIEKVREFIKQEFGENYLPTAPLVYKTKSKSAQEAHEAIRPTNLKGDNSSLTAEQQKLLDLIWKRFVACQMAQSIYDETTIDVTANIIYLLRASGQIMKFDGWRRVMPLKAVEAEVIKLPNIENNEKLALVKIDPQQKFTQPPPRFNEASLIKTLEKLGIGRPSTYAPTISTIQVRAYVEKTDGKFKPTPVGVAVNEFLMKNFANIMEYSFTAQMEDDLDKVADGKKEWTTLMNIFYKPFEKKVKKVGEKSERVKIETEKLNEKCPDCEEGELVIRIGRFGKFISCSRFPDCKYTAKYLQKIDMECPDCKKGEVIIKKTGKGRPFYGCSLYPECKFASWKNPKLVKDKE